jgi:adenosylcobinamide amidohydrolase
LTVANQGRQTLIKMQVYGSVVNTKFLPKTFSILKKNLPRVLSSKCFNDDHLPFVQEVRKTEVAHLFEHILLEHLCQMKISAGAKKAVFNGRTDWNWKKESWGTFNIVIDVNREDWDIFVRAFRKSTDLFNNILTN